MYVTVLWKSGHISNATIGKISPHHPLTEYISIMNIKPCNNSSLKWIVNKTCCAISKRTVVPVHYDNHIICMSLTDATAMWKSSWFGASFFLNQYFVSICCDIVLFGNGNHIMPYNLKVKNEEKKFLFLFLVAN